MLTIIAAHLSVAIAAFFLVGKFGRRAVGWLALAPLSAVVYALIHSDQIFNGNPRIETTQWVPGLDLTLWMRLDQLSWVMTLIVGSVGALVLVYASRYFSNTSHGLRRFAAVFTAFIGMMLGVVQSDHTMGLYLFWEGTSILSFLLIGHHYDRRPARMAARQALQVTTAGSLAMFAGFVILSQAEAGSFRLSELVTHAQNGTLNLSRPELTVAVVLILFGAFSKSALLPAHFWLPGAMAAPTPVSAYLHAAAMVKAGVYLVARMTPGFTHAQYWSPIIVTVGLATMLLGGWRALKQDDLKLVLAYGTVSQLGLITATVGYGSEGTMVAGLTMLVAHAFFKSTLFLTVGAVESATGTRDIRRLSGLAKQQPLLAGAAGLAALSMAGVPVTTGYLGKEAFIATLLDGSEATWALPWHDLAVMGVLSVGSVLTVAYSWRAWWGAFGTRHIPHDEASGTSECTCRPIPVLMQAPVVFLSIGACAGFFPSQLQLLLVPAAEGMPGHAHLAWWSGWEPALITAGILAAAAVLAANARAFLAFQRRFTFPLSVVDVYAWTMRELEIFSARMTMWTQRGSLPWDLSVIVLTLLVFVGGAMFMEPPQHVYVRASDSLFHVLITGIIMIAAVETVRSRRRLRAAIALGGVGLGVALLFASQGAPDLALTQIVVESVSIVVFVLVLRRLPHFFSDRPLASSRWWKLILSALIGVGVVVTGIFVSSARIHEPVSAIMANEALEFGGGQNIVNVILVDIRAWDTVGELSVLLVIASGVASLIYVRSRSGRIDRAPVSLSTPHADESRPLVRRTRRSPFLRGALALSSHERSIVLEVVTRLLFPTMIVLSVWVLLIGHNNPGGGFIGGVIAGLAFVVRYLAGGRHELGEAMPIAPGRILGSGLFIAGAGALAPLLFGNSVVESVSVNVNLGFLGHLHFTTAMVLDIGVYVLVVGLILDLISAMGAEIDRQPCEATSDKTPHSTAPAASAAASSSLPLEHSNGEKRGPSKTGEQ